MNIGLALPHFDFSVPGESPPRPDTVLGWAAKAEELGFDSVWVADHLFFGIEKYGGPPGEFGSYDVLATLAAVARATTRVTIGSLVISAPLRLPTVLAKALATIDVLSGGRLVAGIGAGNFEPEFRAAGVPFERPSVRLQQLEEAITLLRLMWTGGPVSFTGQHYRAVDARCLPTPVQQPAPPVWVGGRGDRLLDLAARHGDGWNTVWAMTPERYRTRVDVLERACERAGRDPASVTRSLGLTALVGEDAGDVARRYDRWRTLAPDGVLDQPLDQWRQERLVGTVDEVREQVAAWAALGVDTLVVNAGPLPFSLYANDDVDVIAHACSLGS